MYIFVRDAPDRPSRSGEEEFFDGHSKNVDSKKIWDVVIALDGLDGIQGVNEMLKGIRVERLYKTEVEGGTLVRRWDGQSHFRSKWKALPSRMGGNQLKL